MKLYHFTSSFHWAGIKNDGEIRVTESNLSMFKTNAGPTVVWLTSDPENKDTLWWRTAFFDKTEVRITVNVPEEEVHHWSEWADDHGIDPAWKKALSLAGGSDNWYVIERSIPEKEWEGNE